MFVLSRLCSYLRSSLHNPKGNKTIVELGVHDPDKFVLCYSILVGPPEHRFTVYQPVNFYTVHHQFRLFGLTLLISFLNIPSDASGDTFHRTTARVEPGMPEDLARFLTEASKGHAENWCISEYNDMRQQLKEKYIERKPDDVKVMLYETAQFFTHPTWNTHEFRAYARRMILYLAVRGIK